MYQQKSPDQLYGSNTKIVDDLPDGLGVEPKRITRNVDQNVQRSFITINRQDSRALDIGLDDLSTDLLQEEMNLKIPSTQTNVRPSTSSSPQNAFQFYDTGNIKMLQENAHIRQNLYERTDDKLEKGLLPEDSPPSQAKLRTPPIKLFSTSSAASSPEPRFISGLDIPIRDKSITSGKPHNGADSPADNMVNFCSAVPYRTQQPRESDRQSGTDKLTHTETGGREQVDMRSRTNMSAGVVKILPWLLFFAFILYNAILGVGYSILLMRVQALETNCMRLQTLKLSILEPTDINKEDTIQVNGNIHIFGKESNFWDGSSLDDGFMNMDTAEKNPVNTDEAKGAEKALDSSGRNGVTSNNRRKWFGFADQRLNSVKQFNLINGHHLTEDETEYKKRGNAENNNGGHQPSQAISLIDLRDSRLSDEESIEFLLDRSNPQENDIPNIRHIRDNSQRKHSKERKKKTGKKGKTNSCNRKEMKAYCDRLNAMKSDHFKAEFFEHFDYGKHFIHQNCVDGQKWGEKIKYRACKDASVTFFDKDTVIPFFNETNYTEHKENSFRLVHRSAHHPGRFVVNKDGFYLVQINITIENKNKSEMTFIALFHNEMASLACQGGGFECPHTNDKNSHKIYTLCTISGVLELHKHDRLEIRTIEDETKVRLENHRTPYFRIILLGDLEVLAQQSG